MRTFHLCDRQGNIFREEKFCGLSCEVWSATYRCIRQQYHDRFKILAQLWKHYYGEDGDAFLSPNEIDLLLQDIKHLKPLLKDIEVAIIKAEKTDIQKIEAFFDDLIDLCQKAKASERSLTVVAD